MAAWRMQISSIRGWVEAGCGWKSRMYSTFGLGGNVPVPSHVSLVAFLSATYSYVASSIASSKCVFPTMQYRGARLAYFSYEIGSYEQTAACLLSYVQLHYMHVYLLFIPPPYND